MWKISLSVFGSIILFSWWLLRREKDRQVYLQSLINSNKRDKYNSGVFIGFLKKLLANHNNIKELLEKAGTTTTVEKYLVQKAVLAIGSAAAGVMLGTPSYIESAIYGLAALLLGYFVPDFALKAKIKSRRKAAENEILEYVETVSTATDAGLLPNDAIRRVCEMSDGVLASEFQKAYSMIAAGKRRADAFKAVAASLDVKDLTLFIDAILQSEETGGQVVETLQAQAARIRTSIKNQGLEKAKKAGVSMAFPILLFIFFPLVIILVAPVAMQLGGLLKFQ